MSARNLHEQLDDHNLNRSTNITVQLRFSIVQISTHSPSVHSFLQSVNPLKTKSICFI